MARPEESPTIECISSDQHTSAFLMEPLSDQHYERLPLQTFLTAFGAEHSATDSVLAPRIIITVRPSPLSLHQNMHNELGTSQVSSATHFMQSLVLLPKLAQHQLHLCFLSKHFNILLKYNIHTEKYTNDEYGLINSHEVIGITEPALRARTRTLSVPRIPFMSPFKPQENLPTCPLTP